MSEDDDAASGVTEEVKAAALSGGEIPVEPAVRENARDNGAGAGGGPKKGLLQIVSDAIALFISGKKQDSSGAIVPESAKKGRPVQGEVSEDIPRFSEADSIIAHDNILISKDLSGTVLSGINAGKEPGEVLIDEDEAETGFADDELRNLFSGTDDRFALVARLFSEGCPMDRLSRFSGMPAGEIRLILNLHKQ